MQLLVHCVNTERFKPNVATRRELRGRFNTEDRFVVVVVAYLIPEKGVDVALRALTTLPERVVLWILGEGNEMENLRDLARKLGIAARTTFHGLQRDVAPFLQAADCLICPSLWAEAAD